MRFEVLGPIQIERDGEPVPLTSGRQRALLANLLIAAGEVVSTDRLIDAVWGDNLPSDPANTLQHGIAQLRKLLEPARTRRDPPQVLRSEGTGYRLDLEGHEVDAALFEAEFNDGRALLESGAAAEASETLEAALARWRGSAYSDFIYADFARAERERLEELRIVARESAIDARLVTEDPDSVIADLEGLVVDYPYREGLRARLMTALYRSGRQADALRAYRAAVQVLGDELGLDPSPELSALEDQILAQEPSLHQTPFGRTPNNLPALTTSLIGRQEELAGVLAFLASKRLITLLGPGGSGKTRLAIEAAHQSTARFPDGVWLVRLDHLNDPWLLAATVGSAMGMPESPDRLVIDTLTNFIAIKRTLLILDNCEHLVEPVADLVGRLLIDCQNLVVLATSQQALQVRGEQRIQVPPLALPGEDAGSPFDDLDTVAAVELFIERAAAIDPDFDRSPAALTSVANIVHALDGMPLAIELAAARVELFTPTEIARRLADGFELLDTGPRDAPRRQRTLRNTVEWSYGLLDADERPFFDRLGVFAGGFDLAAAAAVAEVDGDRALALIGKLVQRSLVTKVASVAGVPRFRMLESLRQFALDRLGDTDTAAEIRNRHLLHFADETHRLDQAIMGLDQRAAFATLIVEEDNLRAAMAWSLESGQLADGIRIAARAGRFWDWRGSLSEANTWLTRFAETTGSESRPDLGFLLSWHSYFTSELGDIEGAKTISQRAKQIATDHNDRYSFAGAVTGLAMFARIEGTPAEAVRLDAEVRAVGEELGDQWLGTWADNHDALALLAIGDARAAEAAAHRSLEGFRALGDRRATGWALTALAQIAHHRDDHGTAATHASEAVTVSREAGDGRNAAWAYEIAAAAARASGNADRARDLETEAAELLTARGMPFSPWRR